MPSASPFFDGSRVAITAARGETIGLLVWHREPGAISLTVDGARVEAFDTKPAHVVRASTAMYGGSHGEGDYPDALVATKSPTSNPAYFRLTADHGGVGQLQVGARTVPVALDVAPVTMPELPLAVWAYYDAHELGGTNDAPSDAERACIAMFRSYGVLLSPDLPASAWSARRALLDDAPYVPAVIDTNDVAGSVRAWLANTDGTNQRPFAIPIDEPHTPDARAKVKAIGEAVHAAGKGFLMAVTDERRADYGDAVDVFFSLAAKHGDWTYNGAPPRAGSMVVDAESPGMRTWGWIGYRYAIPVWYAWNATYWHDKYNKHGALDIARDAVSFDSGDDRGNLDGVLVWPGCEPTLRLEALRRGLQDRALLEVAARCDRADADRIAARMIPRALGDAKERGDAAWPRDEAAWEAARLELLQLAANCAR